MKKVLLSVLALLMCTSMAYSESLSIGELLQKIPDLQQGIAYSLADSRFNYLATVELMDFKGISLSAGFAGQAKNTADKAVVNISYDMLKLKDLGVTIPILDLVKIEPGIYAGFGDINMENLDEAEFDYGVSVTLISVSF